MQTTESGTPSVVRLVDDRIVVINKNEAYLRIRITPRSLDRPTDRPSASKDEPRSGADVACARTSLETIL